MRARRSNVFIVLMAAKVWVTSELIITLALPTTHPPINVMDPRGFIEKYRPKIEELIHGRTRFVAFDSTLGWSHKPGSGIGMYRANGQALRANRDYSEVPAENVIRIASFGDSFMLGADIEVEQTWQASLEASNPSLEVLNFGVSSYGTGQSVMRYLTEGKRLSPDFVVLSFITENSRRNVNTFRPFYLPQTGLPLAKPRYRIEGEELILVPNPIQRLEQYQDLLDHPEIEIPRIGENDDYYSQYLPKQTSVIDNIPSVQAATFWFRRFQNWWRGHFEGAAVQNDWYTKGPQKNPLLFRIFDHFQDEAVAAGSRPIFLLFPIHLEYRDAGPFGEMPYAFVKRFLEHKGYTFIDCDEVFRVWLNQGHSWSELYAYGIKGGHYSPAAHRLIAAAIEDLIRDGTVDHPTSAPRGGLAAGPKIQPN